MKDTHQKRQNPTWWWWGGRMGLASVKGLPPAVEGDGTLLLHPPKRGPSRPRNRTQDTRASDFALI